MSAIDAKSQVDLWRKEGAEETKNAAISELQSQVRDLETERQTHLKKIAELESWIRCLSDSALIATGNTREAKAFQNQIQYVS